jgi:endonuclease YncB( thermonuclease family)
VVDGDTTWVRGVYGYRAGIDFKVRFAAINAPELDTPEGVLAARELNRLLYGRCVVVAVPKSDVRDKYGRTIGVVLLPVAGGFLNVNHSLVRRGLARAVDYGIPPEVLLRQDIYVPEWVRDAISHRC